MKASRIVLAFGAAAVALGSVGILARRHTTPTVAPSASTAPLALTGRVVDAAHLLTDVDRNRVIGKLMALEKSSGHQFVVVTTPNLGGKTIEAYGLALGNGWHIGRKGSNDGVLLIVAPNERQARIEVGYGLESTLTNARAQLIVNDMIPYFARHDYPGGIGLGVDEIIKVIS